MRNVIVPKAYDAFGSVVGMKNFATLGLVLMGVLARVWRMIKPSEEEIALAEEAKAMVKALEERADADEEGVVVLREEYGGDDDDGDFINKAEYYKLDALREVDSVDQESVASEKKEKGKASLKAKPYDAPKKDQSLPIRTQLQRETSQPSPPAETFKKTLKEKCKAAVKRKSDAAEPEKKKKKKKKGEDIDDLFSGLF